MLSHEHVTNLSFDINKIFATKSECSFIVSKHSPDSISNIYIGTSSNPHIILLLGAFLTQITLLLKVSFLSIHLVQNPTI